MEVHEIDKKSEKGVHLGEGMYKEKEATPDFERFVLPFGGHLNGENRWVKLAAIIPWEEIEEHYKGHFSKRIGRTAKTVRLAFGALVIKERLHLTDEETVEMIRENPYLQYFLGYESYRDEKPFDPTMMVHFRKRLGAEEIGRINELLAKKHHKKTAGKDKKNDDNSKGAGNSGQLIIDSTCAPQDIRHPNDVTLLDEARTKTEEMIDALYKESERVEKPRTYRKKARVQYLDFIRGKRRTKGEIRRATRQQLQYLRRNLRIIKDLQEEAPVGTLTKKQRRDLIVISEIERQQTELYKKKTHSIQGKIVSIAQPHVRPIARGKARAAFEFGAKLSASRTEQGFVFIDKLSWEPYNESGDLPMQVEKYRERFGHYPESVHADKIYRTRENRKYCEEKGIRLSGPPLGRPRVANEMNRAMIRAQRKRNRIDEAIRQSIEGSFGKLKRTMSLSNIYEKLKATSETTIIVCVLLANGDKILRDLFMRLLHCLGFGHGNMHRFVEFIPVPHGLPKNSIEACQ